MGMTITEGMKTLKVLEKRIQSNLTDIEKYSSMVSTERPFFESEDQQRKEVASLIQANTDLEKEYRNLKKNVDYTNLSVSIEFDGVEYTIADLLILKRKTARFILGTLGAMNEHAGQRRLRTAPTIEGKTPQVVRLYSEEEKNKKVRKWQELLDNITIRLETINSTTDLIEHF